MKRSHRISFMLNDKEVDALERYIKKYKIKCKSKFVREALMITVIRKLEEDSPTLFD
ncbi:MAG: hypothetical protein BWY47_00887 [Bacteroidetes bacterium ADurb.Bin302]|nr:MAG: hypothetical protein BWY47_00887 [Bacteroidetes bacterium ADurb.Bin302]HPG55552.1 hypothetical protein [Candidatus Enterocola sp.]